MVIFTRSRLAIALLLSHVACAGPEPLPEPTPEPLPEPPPVVEEPEPDVQEPVSQLPESVAATTTRLFARELEDGVAPEMLREFTRTAPGRSVGSMAHEQAIRWALAKLTNIGAWDVHREPVVVSEWSRGEPESAVVHDGDVETPLSILALNGSVGTPRQGTSAEVIRFENLAALQERRAEVQGKIVFFDARMRRGVVDPRDSYAEIAVLFTEGVIEAGRAGAVAALVRSPTLADDDYPRAAWTDFRNPSWIPAATLSPRSADELASLCAGGAPVKVSLSIDARRAISPILSSNVIAEVRGLKFPEEIVLLTARLDGIDFGEQAHVDGAAVVHCIEALRLLLATGVRPERTVRVALFVDGEEPGRGLRSYTRDHADELEFHRAIIYSRRGAYAPRGFACTVREADVERVSDVVSALRVVNRFERASSPPRLESFGAIPILELESDPHHLFDVQRSVLDTFETIDPRYLRLGAAACAAIAAALADPAAF